MSLVVAVRRPWLHRWGEDEDSFNVDMGEDDPDAVGDGSGLPGRSLVGRAMSTWALNTPNATAAMAAAAFNLPIAFAEDAFRPDIYRPASLSDAVQAWSATFGGVAPVDVAAVVFGVTCDEIEAAVEDHYWMFVDFSGGRRHVEHEGL